MGATCNMCVEEMRTSCKDLVVRPKWEEFAWEDKAQWQDKFISEEWCEGSQRTEFILHRDQWEVTLSREMKL